MKALAIPLRIGRAVSRVGHGQPTRVGVRVVLGSIQIFCALTLIGLSLWAILLPPLFPYSSHSIVNSKVVSLRASDEGTINGLPTVGRGNLLKAGESIGRVTRDQTKVRRELEEREFTRTKLREQVGIIESSIAQREKKLSEMEKEAAATRLTAREALERRYRSAVENVRIQREAYAQKQANQERIAPLFRDGIITSGQWAETRAQTTEAERQFTAAESEWFMIKTELENTGSLGGDLSREAIEGLVARIGSYEQELGNLKIQRNELAAELSEVERQIAWARTTLESDQSYAINTPIEGVVWRQQVVNGETLADGQTVLQIADARGIFVEAYFRREFMNSIAIGDAAHVFLVTENRFVEGLVTDIQVQEQTPSVPNIINTISTDASLLRVTIEVQPDELKPASIGQLAKVLVSSGKRGLVEKCLVRLSFLLRSHG
ncbi:HlyD family secretion protein [Synoicihabitans lomoniglobus]|uniref:HlyD family efflux transporter periplasmic adaptor subunit n=1 Tax=Synoicihabitans lomoniglobus TaxID=2909285 RepID=A0AAE9ZWF0_9BACT|nr:HlyD family secretion protein [Opitutaceae bacterium LMO-M01]WED64434.1 HlyD family efflux transporter periplasmic adaptor subunit [Opitutaceae bacterium LMO-M01]